VRWPPHAVPRATPHCPPPPLRQRVGPHRRRPLGVTQRQLMYNKRLRGKMARRYHTLDLWYMFAYIIIHMYMCIYTYICNCVYIIYICVCVGVCARAIMWYTILNTWRRIAAGICIYIYTYIYIYYKPEILIHLYTTSHRGWLGEHKSKMRAQEAPTVAEFPCLKTSYEICGEASVLSLDGIGWHWVAGSIRDQ
jgi:hypothetical protein